MILALQNHSTLVSDAEVQSWIPGLQAQIDEDFAPFYPTNARIMWVERHYEIPRGAWPIRVFDDADLAGALGYHEHDEGVPEAKVFARVTLAQGASLSVVTSHEILEVLANPRVSNVCIADVQVGGFRGGICAAIPYEVADAPEADQFAYLKKGVRVSDFCLPHWFPDTTVIPGYEGRYSFTGALKEPFSVDNRGIVHGLLAGGYIGIRTFRRPTDWTTVNASRGNPHRAPTAAAMLDVEEAIDGVLPRDVPVAFYHDGHVERANEVPKGSRRAKVLAKMA